MRQGREKERRKLTKILRDPWEYVKVIILVETKLGHEQKVTEKENHSNRSPRDERGFDARFYYHQRPAN